MPAFLTSYDFWTAIGTVGAVVLAVVLQILKWWITRARRPVLKLEYQPIAPWVREAVPHGCGPMLYHRISVRNCGKTPALGVAVCLVAFHDERGEDIRDFDPFELHWAGTEVGRRQTVHLLAGQKEYVDLLALPVRQNPQGQPMVFQLMPQSNKPRGVPWGRAVAGQTFTVRAASRTAAADPVDLRLRLTSAPQDNDARRVELSEVAGR